MLQDDQQQNVDHHGRQSLLNTYIQYQCKIPHPLASTSKMGTRRKDAELER